jgi:O-antigen ligase
MNLLTNNIMYRLENGYLQILGWLEARSQFLLRLAVIAVVLLASLYFGRRPSTRFILLPLVGIVVLIFLRWPFVGLVALLTSTLLIPFGLGTGTQTDLNIVILLLPVLIGLWFLDMLVIQRSITLRPMRVVLPLLLLCLVALLAFLMGQLPWFDAIPKAPLKSQLGGLAIFWLSAGAFLLVAHQIRDIRWLEWLTWIFIALGSIYVLARMLPLFGPRITGLYPHGATGSLFWVWLVALSLSQAIFHKKLDHRLRILLVLLVIGVFYVSLFQTRAWASGWLPPLIAILTVLIFWKPRLGISISLIIVITFILRLESIVSAVFSLEEYSYITRLAAWEIVIDLIKVNPILGLGPANYYFYTPLYSLMGYLVKFNSHNQYIDIIAQTGLIGFACFAWFVWQVGKLGFSLVKQAPEGFSRAYAYGALGGLAGTLVAGMLADWIIPFVYNIGFSGFRASVLGWIFLGGMVALGQIIEDSPEREASP